MLNINQNFIFINVFKKCILKILPNVFCFRTLFKVSIRICSVFFFNHLEKTYKFTRSVIKIREGCYAKSRVSDVAHDRVKMTIYVQREKFRKSFRSKFSIGRLTEHGHVDLLNRIPYTATKVVRYFMIVVQVQIFAAHICSI